MDILDYGYYIRQERYVWIYNIRHERLTLTPDIYGSAGTFRLTHYRTAVVCLERV